LDARTTYRLFLIPSVLVLFLITLFPFGYLIYVSFFEYDITKPYLGFEFNSGQNYVSLLLNDRFWNALRVSFSYTLTVVILEVIFGLGIALLLNRELKGRRVIQTILLLPTTITPVVVGLVWRLLYHPQFGLVDYLLSLFAIPTVQWTSDPLLALPAVIIIDIWEWTPFVAIVLLSGLMSLPKEPFEAALVDGASAWQIFRNVTFPLILPTIGIATMFRTIDAFRTFDIIVMTTGGGPGIATETVDLYGYFVGFARGGRIAYTAALSVIMLYATVLLALLFNRQLARSKGK